MDFPSYEFIGYIIGVLGTSLAIWFYYHPKQNAQPVYQARSYKLLDKEKEKDKYPVNLNFIFDGTIIPRITKCFIIFWNAGYKELNDSDTKGSNPLKIEFCPDGKVLSARIVKGTKDLTNFKLKWEKNWIFIDFDFLNAKDGIQIEVFHTSEGYPNIKGEIKGVPKGVVNLGVIPPSRTDIGPFPFLFKKIPIKTSFRTLVVLLLLYSVLGTIGSIYLFLNRVLIPVMFILIIIWGGLFIFSLWALIKSRRRFPKALSLQD